MVLEDAPRSNFFRLSSPPEEMDSYYDVVVIGSGYGGGVAASRFSSLIDKSTDKRLSVAVLERGIERIPGDFPETTVDALQQLQLTTTSDAAPNCKTKKVGHPTGLYDIRIYDNCIVVMGNGLGGTSLINANVVVEAEPEIYQSKQWPTVIQDAWKKDIQGKREIDQYVNKVKTMLHANEYPEGWPVLSKMDALKFATSRNPSLRWAKTPIAVKFKETKHDCGYIAPACNLCGNCCSGCNTGAKGTTNTTYVATAWAHGASVFTGVLVSHLEQVQETGGWNIYYKTMDDGDRVGFVGAGQKFIRAKRVILGAGALGSTEILLRSRQMYPEQFRLSSKIGNHYSGNGDSLGAAIGTTRKIVSFGNPTSQDSLQNHNRAPGPCITSVTRPNDIEEISGGFVIEDCTIPGVLRPVLSPALPLSSLLNHLSNLTEGANDTKRVKAIVRNIQKEKAVRKAKQTQNNNDTDHIEPFLIMSHDDYPGASTGKMQLTKKGEFYISWPDSYLANNYQLANDACNLLGESLQMNYQLGNPLLRAEHTISVHPLGGSCMAESCLQGVVNDRGQVFDTKSDTSIYEGLYVMDAAIVPQSLGTNPLLTIASLAERCCDLAFQREPDLKKMVVSTEIARPNIIVEDTCHTPTEVSFSERMVGNLLDPKTQTYFPISFVLTVIVPDLKQLEKNPGTIGALSGSIDCDRFGIQELSVSRGRFHLFKYNPDTVASSSMEYDFDFIAADGRSYHFHGVKNVHNRFASIFEIWTDTTTLFVTVTDTKSKIEYTGTLKIKPLDLIRQGFSMRATKADSGWIMNTFWNNPTGLARFGVVFATEIWNTYVRLKSQTPALTLEHRVLNLPFESFLCTTADGQWLPITKYKAEPGSIKRKHPLILFHGMGVSSRIYSTPCIEKTMVEYFCENGYECYLAELRMSIDIPESSKKNWQIKDLGLFDYPAIIHKVIEVSGVNKVFILAHCVAAATLSYNILKDEQTRLLIQGIAFSQLGFCTIGSTINRIKATARLADGLGLLGVPGLDPSIPDETNFLLRNFAKLEATLTCGWGEYCSDDSCKMITFMYGLLWEHGNLNQTTHTALQSMFGYGCVPLFKDLAASIRRQSVVPDLEKYVPGLVQTRMPIHLVHGANNVCWDPQSSREMLKWLQSEASKSKLDTSFYSAEFIPDYGHIDCIFGKNAHVDVFPSFLNFYNKYDNAVIGNSNIPGGKLTTIGKQKSRVTQ